MSRETSKMFLNPAAPSPVYPRTYRASIAWQIYSVLLSGVVAAGGLAGIWYLGMGHGTHGPGEQIGLPLMLAPVVPYCVYDIFDTLRFQVILDADAIEVRRAWGKRRVERPMISGRRIVTSRHAYLSPKTLVLIPERGRGRPLRLPLVMQLDPPFLSWMEGIPDLDTKIA